jgi:FMN phosphatase YigB (HAD superfamily)
MIKAIVFDVDGVILKYNLFSDRYCARFNLPIETLAPFFQNEFRKSVIGEIDIKKLLEKYVSEWKWNQSIDELMEYWLSEDEVDSGMIQLIKQLNQRRVKTYIGSNQEQHRAEYIRVKLG